MIPLNQNLMLLRRSGIRRYTELAASVPDCISLALGEPGFDTPQPIRDAACAALFGGQTHYAPNQGTAELRSAIAGYETQRGMPITPAQVLVTAGATGALFTALLGILNPGDEVIVPVPAFPLYESIVTMAGARFVPLVTQPDGFQIRPAALAAVMSPRTKAIILNSPNNPTGIVYDAASLAAVKAAILKKPIFLLCDNVYDRLSAAPCPDLSRDPALREQVLLCQSFSKPYAMTGWRVGYLAGPEDVIARLVLLSAAEIACVPTFLQTACVAALREDVSPTASAYTRRRAYVCARLDGMGLPYPRPEGAFYAFPDISRFGLSSGALCTRMIREAHVAAVPGSCFGAEGYLRISFGCDDEQLRRGLDRMERFFRELLP